MLAGRSHAGIYCCTTKDPKLRAVKQPFGFAHNSVGQDSGKGSAGWFLWAPRGVGGPASSSQVWPLGVPWPFPVLQVVSRHSGLPSVACFSFSHMVGSGVKGIEHLTQRNWKPSGQVRAMSRTGASPLLPYSIRQRSHRALLGSGRAETVFTLHG